jgi:S-adenosylmethionine:diacylglycerol 3-amino-3-carboxypropyl transferase
MYEDVAVEQAAFAGKGRVFCIASAGDTAFALAQSHDVVACDINPVQLAYAKARAAGGPRRLGDADRAMNAMRMVMPLIGWQRGKLEQFLAMEDVGAQLRFWRERLDTWRLRTGIGLLMSRAVLSVVYSRPLLDAIEPGFGAVLLQRMERTFSLFPNARNPYARALLLGTEDKGEVDARLPGGVVWECGDAASVLESYAAGSFDGFTLSNILDGASAEYRERLLRAVRRAAAPGAVVVIRSFARSSGWPSGEDRVLDDRSILWGEVRVAPILDTDSGPTEQMRSYGTRDSGHSQPVS